MMKHGSVRFWVTLVIAMGLGVLLHFLYDWFPYSLIALISPVRESIWEHLKILFYPLLLSGLFLGGKRGITPWLFSLLTICGLMLLFGWLYNVVLQGQWDGFNILLYIVLMLLGFYLPRILWSLTEWPGVGAACAMLTVLLAALMIGFTFAPPNNILFQDLSGGVRTFLTIPV